MAVAARRERERTARREAILDAAQELITAEGYHGLRMDAVAEAVELSKGMIISVFSRTQHQAFLLVLVVGMVDLLAGAHAVEQVGHPRHVLGAARNHDIGVVALDGLGSQHHGLETGSAHLVDRDGRGWVSPATGCAAGGSGHGAASFCSWREAGRRDQRLN